MTWADLLPDLCIKIAEKLEENEMDHLRFRSICPLWRSSTLPLRKPPPLPSLPTLSDPKTPKKASLVEKTVYLLQIPEDLWNLPHMKKFKRTFVIKVSKPFSPDKIRIESLLSHTSLENRAKPSPPLGTVLNLWNLRVIELCKVFYTPKRESGIVSLRISSAGEQLTAMAIENEGLLYQYKSGEKKWIKNGMDNVWDDIINYQGQFCAVDIEGTTFLFDSSFAATEISSALLDYQNNIPTLKRLVESCGKLYLVELYNDQPKIYRLNMEEKAWIQVESLGDRIFFFADDCSFSLSAQEFPGYKGNCVYFKFEVNEEEHDERLRFCGPNTQVYDLETGNFGRITTFPEHLQIFWPPPKWLEDPTPLPSA